MRRFVVFIAIGAAQLAGAAESMRIDGVRVFGRIHDLSTRQIHAAIAEATDLIVRKPRALEILSSTEVRAYLPERDMGWVPYRLTPWAGPNNHRPPVWSSFGRAIDDTPEALRLIRAADQVYIFPVTFTEAKAPFNRTYIIPHGEYKHLRSLNADASRKLRRLLGTESHWFHGADNTFGIGSEPKNVGFIFLRGKDKLALVCYARWRAKGTFHGEHTSGSLEEKWSDKLDEWRKEYAKPEFGIK